MTAANRHETFVHSREHNHMSTTLPDLGQITVAKIDGLDIRYARTGRSDGTPILFTSPWPESIYAFRGVLPTAKSLGPVILVDLPGFGRSGGRPDVMSPEAMGDFVINLALSVRSTAAPW
jgi:pimeloyl-ACP methyl ester carboxylesterase